MKNILLYLFLFLSISSTGQIFHGEVFVRGDRATYLNKIFVTNLRTQQTAICDYKGIFYINAQVGDLIRFTSIFTERKDMILSSEILQNKNNIIELAMAYKDIAEVRLYRFKPSGILKKDVIALDNEKSEFALRKKLGLSQPKNRDISTESPVNLGNGGLSIDLEAIYDLLSGEQRRKKRLYDYEKMQQTTTAIRKYYGDDYFQALKIPSNFIDDFLQFIYTSEKLGPLAEKNQYEVIKIYFEKYLPVYHKRLKNTEIMKQIYMP